MYCFANGNIRRQVRKGIIVVMLVGIFTAGCGRNVSVSFDSADGLTQKQLENALGEQTDTYGDDAKDQADQIYDGAKEKSLSGYDSLMQTTDDILHGKTRGVDFAKLTKNGLYYFLVVKQYLYNHIIKVLVIHWLIVGLLAFFFRFKNRAAEKTVLSILGFGGTIIILAIVFSPI